MTMKKSSAGILGILSMGMALGAMDNLGEPRGAVTDNEGVKEIQQWARKKVAEERAKKEEKEKRKWLSKPKNKNAKHVFKVTYSKGKDPVFDKSATK